MLSEPLPTTMDVRKAAAREVVVEGCLQPSNLPRLGELLASDQGRIEVKCNFFRDEEYRSILAIEVTAELQTICQRCLEAMPISIASSNELAIISDDEMARQLPARLDPLIVEGEECGLWDVVEDELILALPIVSYHKPEDCKQILDDYSAPGPSEEMSRDNPFKVLEQLKSGQDNQEY